jgi:hypothetical protein
MRHRDLGIGVAVVAAALLMVTAGFAIGSRARSRQAAISSEPPVAAPAGTAAATTVPADAAGAGPGAAAGTPGAAGAAPTGAAGRAPVVGAPVPASGPLLAVPAAPARLAAGAELTCAQLGGRALGLVPLTCGRVGLAPSGRPVLWISGRVPDSQALQLQVWSFTGTGAWTQSLVATEPAPARTWAVVRVAAPALSPRGRTLLAQFRSLGPGALLAYDLVGFPVSGPPKVLAHRDGLVQGSVRAATTAAGTPVLDEYSAAAGQRGSLDRNRIGLAGGVFRYLARDRVPAPAAGG